MHSDVGISTRLRYDVVELLSLRFGSLLRFSGPLIYSSPGTGTGTLPGNHILSINSFHNPLTYSRGPLFPLSTRQEIRELFKSIERSVLTLGGQSRESRIIYFMLGGCIWNIKEVEDREKCGL